MNDKEVLAGCRHGDEGKKSYGWCQQCAAEEFENGFCEWTSNSHINKMIQWTQKHSTQVCDYLVFIEYDRLKDVEPFASGRYGSVYKACWLDGPRWSWNSSENIWECEANMQVALKRFNNSKNTSTDFMNQVFKHVKFLTNGFLADFFGITEDPSGDYMFVMKFYEDGNLYEYLKKNHDLISWRDTVEMLCSIAEGLDQIHTGGRFHSNLHGGNILIEDEAISIDARISDVGLHGPADERRSPTDNYGAMPFVAPEVLRREQPEESEVCKFNQAADIYSFGIIMATISTGKKPFFDRVHDQSLIEDICTENLRPKISEELMPQAYYELMKKCWNENPGERPDASELHETFKNWTSSLCDDPDLSDIAFQFYEADDNKWKSIASMNKIILYPDPDSDPDPDPDPDHIDEKSHLRTQEIQTCASLLS